MLTSTNQFQMQSGTAGAQLAGGNGLSKTTGGTVALNNSNSFTGGVSIDAGILTLGDDNALNGNAVTFTAGTSGKLQINGHTVSISGLTTNSGSPGSAIVENGNATADAALTVNVSTPNTFAGVVQNGGTGKLALTVGGAPSLALSGHNTFTGGTTINATATLQVSGGQALDDNSAVTDNGTLDLVAERNDRLAHRQRHRHRFRSDHTHPLQWRQLRRHHSGRQRNAGSNTHRRHTHFVKPAEQLQRRHDHQQRRDAAAYGISAHSRRSQQRQRRPGRYARSG